MSSISLEEYKKMIYKFAYSYSCRYHLDRSEVLSQGYLIFVEAMNSYDESRAKFSTYLWENLNNRLNKYCEMECKKWTDTMVLDSDYPFVSGIEDFREIDSELVMENSKKMLSFEAKQILEYIINREWEKEVQRLTIQRIMEEFRCRGWNVNKIMRTMDELRSWWRKSVV